MDLLEEYRHYSRYKLDVTKTKILTLNYTPTIRIRDKSKLRWGIGKIKYFGVNITKEPDKIYNANYTQIDQNINGMG